MLCIALKAVQMYQQQSLIREFMLYEIEPGDNETEVTKTHVVRTKSKGDVDHSIVTAKLLKSQDGNLFFARVKTGVWHLIPRRISPCSESFPGHIGTGILCGGWFGARLTAAGKGFPDFTLHTHTHQATSSSHP